MFTWPDLAPGALHLPLSGPSYANVLYVFTPTKDVTPEPWPPPALFGGRHKVTGVREMERYCPLSASTCSRSPRAEISVVCWPLVIDTGPDLGDLPMGPPYKTGLVHLTYFYTTALFPFLKTLYTDAVNRRHQSET